LNFKNGS